jgi:hypothetical protein
MPLEIGQQYIGPELIIATIVNVHENMNTIWVAWSTDESQVHVAAPSYFLHKFPKLIVYEKKS